MQCLRSRSWCAYLTTEISANWRLPPLRRSWPRHSLPAECWRSKRRAQPGSVWMHRSKRVKSTLRAALKSWRRSMRTVWKRMLRVHRRFCCRGGAESGVRSLFRCVDRCPEAGRTLLRGGGVERCRYSGLLRAGFAIPNVERRKRFLCWTVQCEFCRYERRFYSRCSE